MTKKRVGVILSGSGYLDGAEIREAVLTLLSLDRSEYPLDVHCLAPDIKQDRVMNHLTQERQEGDTRSILVESARIARGEIQDLEKANPDEFHGVLMPGGFGAALNLSDFAHKGGSGKVIGPLKSFLTGFHQNNKPLGAICIAPAIIALLLGHKRAVLTIGEDKETALEIEKTGAIHKNCPVDDIVVDEKLKIVTTPAYMYGNARLKDIAMGIDKCVKQVLKWI